ncbi:MAG: HAD family hydrolase [Verrucomicrobiales bacterium]|nr:HAD family hydrolase [Verrucomicrobiales bacterium]
MASPNKHIIWDWNGTLLNDTWLCVDVLNGLLAKRNREPISEETYRQNFGFPVIHFYEYLGFDTGLDSFEKISHEFIGTYEERWLEQCALHSETVEMLSELSDLGHTHSVLSAAKQEALQIGIEHFGIRPFFTGLMGTDNIYAAGKIDQGRRWIDQLHWKPEEIVLVGDTLHDLEVAEAIGTHCILLTHGHHTPERLAASGAPVVHSNRELIQKLGPV